MKDNREFKDEIPSVESGNLKTSVFMSAAGEMLRKRKGSRTVVRGEAVMADD
jgi:hypothetical protein